MDGDAIKLVLRALEDAQNDRDALRQRLSTIESERALQMSATDIGIQAQASLREAINVAEKKLALSEATAHRGIALLVRVRANAVASFFLSAALSEDITKLLGENP